MMRFYYWRSFILLLGLVSPVFSGESVENSTTKPMTWIADNGNGTYSNPLFYEEFSDPDVIRVGNDYYLAGTTMHAMPGLYVLHSKDLVNWNLASYCFDRLDLAPAFHLEGGEIYGQGVWAPCIRYHEGTFYVFTNINNYGTHVFRSKSPAGPWEHNQLPATLYDLSVLFDDDGKVYAVSGVRNILLAQLKEDLSDIIPGTQHQILNRGMGEGLHFYKIKGKYYIVSAMPGAHTDMVVARADTLDGPWQIERMIAGESLGVPTQSSSRVAGRGNDQTYQQIAHDPNEGGGLTLHQGGIVDTPSGQWWSIIMQDHGSVGRLSALVPITWENDFPIIGLQGNLRKAPNTWLKPDTGFKQDPKPLWTRNDNFNSTTMNSIWQWNHAPDDGKWSLKEKSGVLRLHALPAPNFWMARNTLTQRSVGPESTVTVEIDGSAMQDGDTAGLALLNQPYAWIGLVKKADSLQIAVYDQVTGKTTNNDVKSSHLWLRAECNFDTEKAVFRWSDDGRTFSPLGDPFPMIFQLKTFQGVRYGLFNYSISKENAGGYVDFDNFTVEEPRAAGIERSIPLGKTISLVSVADGCLISCKDAEKTLQSLPPDSPDAQSDKVHFEVIDCGQGRVALRSADGRFLSVVPTGDKITLKTVENTGSAPTLTDAETFQWVNLLKGHVMLMSLTNHRYVTSKPNAPGPVSADSTGPRPDRKEGSCFRWNVVK